MAFEPGMGEVHRARDTKLPRRSCLNWSVTVFAKSPGLVYVFLLWVTGTGVAQDPGEPTVFSVCGSQVQGVTLRVSGNQFLVTIQLAQDASDDWEAFTTEHLAHLVQVKAGSVLLVEAQLRTPVPSGLIEIARPDRASAEDLHAVVQAAPESPCGAEG